MGASFEEQKRKLFIVLFPSHQPVWLNVTFPLPFMIAFQLMWTVLVRKCTCFREDRDSLLDSIYIQASLGTLS